MVQNLIRTNNQVDGDPVDTGDRIDIPASWLRQDVMKPGVVYSLPLLPNDNYGY